jgi:hypothetical protein
MDRVAEADRLARIYVWWQEPAVTLEDPRKLLCQILRLARPEDYVAAEEIWGREALRQVLLAASDDLDRDALRRGCPLLIEAKTLQDEPNTLTVVADESGAAIKLSFFGGIDSVASVIRSV